VPTPDLTAQTDALIAWLSTNGVALVVIALVVFLVYRWARPHLHSFLVDAIERQAETLGDDSARRVEIEKRVTTVEELLTKVLRGFVVLAVIGLVFAWFDLWGLLAGLGLVIAAITLAGQAIVLDYLMGVLILVEGQYFKGDTIRIGAIEGVVEEVGLRRTVIRDPRGALHSISNGMIRDPANLTRSYALAMVHIDGIADGDVERAIVALDAAGRAVADDPELKGTIIEVPRYTSTTQLSAYGATLRVAGRVQPEARLRVEAELRRRIAAELAAAEITPIRPVGGSTAPGAGRVR
jgi:small conductance mechanosensitive channel